jgi:hypothetical protein
MTQGHLETRIRIPNVYKHTKPNLPPKQGTFVCSLAIYKKTLLPATLTPLCILNLIPY